MLTAFNSSIIAIAVFLLAIGFSAFASFALGSSFIIHFFPQGLESLCVQLDICAICALTVLATEESIAKALAVQLQTFGFFTIALKFSLGLVGAGLWSLYGDKRIVFQNILKAIILGELNRVQLSQLDLTALPLPKQVVKNILSFLRLVFEQKQFALFSYFVCYPFGVGWDCQFAYLHYYTKILIDLINMARKINHYGYLQIHCPNKPPSLISIPSQSANQQALNKLSQLEGLCCLKRFCCYQLMLFKQSLIYNNMGNNPANRQRLGSENQLLVGFENKPLTLCYANSILQVLFHHPVFSSIVQKSDYSDGILFHLKQLLEQMNRRKKHESVSTSKLMKFIEKQSAMFERERHQDCHQFYIWLMNSINDQIKGKDKKKLTSLQEQFFSKRVTRTICQVCQNTTEREEEEVDLSLVLPQPNVSLNYCINNYSKQQKLAGRDKFKCDKCGDLVQALKATHIKTLPNFLSIHLRRFKYDEIKKGITKLVWQIPFPFKLKLKSTYSEKELNDQIYKLVGVVVHLGTGQNYGHYISYIKIGSKWFVFNDDEISETQDYMLQSLWGYKGLSKCAYMLFYSI